MPSSATQPYQRVDFILGILFLLLGGVLLFWTARFLQPVHNHPITPGSYHFIVKLDGVAPGTAYDFELEGKPWLLVRTGNGTIAVSATCTYRGSRIRWDNSNHVFTCEGHGDTFSRLGGPISGLATSPLETLRLKVINGLVYGARDLS